MQAVKSGYNCRMSLPQPTTDVISRIAPTPSGYLHIGNAANFLVTWLAVRLRGGTLHLRIDDLDRDRCKPVYIDDVFKTLEWLGIEPDFGPSGTEDFLRNHSQTLRYDIYKAALMQMRENGAHLYACTCSRKMLASKPLYPGTCRHANHELVPRESAMRIAVPEQTEIAFGSETVALDRVMGDFVVWRRDDIPAYQLVSVIEDKRLGVNLIVRGIDLLHSSAAQRFLAPFLKADTFERATFVHHDLLLRPDGSKFSKSDADYSLRDLRASLGDRAALLKVMEQTQRLLGLEPETVETPDALLQSLQAAALPRILQTN